MDYLLDLDPTHSVLRLTVTAEIVTMEIAEDIYTRLKQISSRGGPYAAIYDLSATKETTIPVEVVRRYGRRNPSVPMGRPHVVVGKEKAIYGLARLFGMCGEAVGKEHEIVHTLDEAYKIVGARPEDFTQHLFPERMAA